MRFAAAFTVAVFAVGALLTDVAVQGVGASPDGRIHAAHHQDPAIAAARNRLSALRDKQGASTSSDVDHLSFKAEFIRRREALARDPTKRRPRNKPVAGMKNVHLVSHTHDDTGWLKTVDQYYFGSNNSNIYFAGVQYILDSVVSQLLQNPDRKFTYVEQAFFARWWDEQDAAMKANVRRLVKDGQLQFVNGGWCMHDEAGPFYLDMIDQTTLGHRFLLQELGVRPTTGWQIDPFGHSSTNAALLSVQAGFDSLYFGRADFRNYAYREQTMSREFNWHASWSHPQTNRLFTGILLTNHYGTPEGFGWDVRDPPADPVQDNPSMREFNVPYWFDLFMPIAQHDFTVTLGDHIMWTMGDDFNYQDAHFWFKNMDRLIDNLNMMQDTYHIFYSTPNDYSKAKIQERDSGAVNYPNLTNDFFPYADGPHAFWTGYFTSRAALKRYVRDTSNAFTALRQWRSFSPVVTPSPPVPQRSRLAEAMGLLQHHDAVAGTAKQHVAFDYARRISEGRESYFNDTVGAILALLNVSSADNASTVMWCGLANVSQCDPLVNYTTNSLPMTVVVWNSLSYNRFVSVRVPVPSYEWATAFVGPQDIQVYAAPESVTNYDRDGNPNAQPYLAVFQVFVPALGYTTVPINPPLFPPQAAVSSKSVHEKKAQPLHHPRRHGGDAVDTNDTVYMTNAHLKVAISKTQWIQSIQSFDSGVTLSVTQDWCFYLSSTGDGLSQQRSGAYIFRPMQDTACYDLMQNATVSITVISDRIPEMVVERVITTSDSDTWIRERLTLAMNDAHLRHEFTVGPIPVGDGVGKEVIARWHTNVSNRGVFYTDSNGREMQARQLNTRPNYPFNQTEFIAGNFYPVNAVALVQDASASFFVVVDSTVSGSSLHDGEIETMVHRRLLYDDWRGVGEPLDETEWITPYDNCQNGGDCGQHYGPGLIVRGEHWIGVALGNSNPSSATPLRHAAQRYRAMVDEMYARPLLLLAQTAAALPAVTASLMPAAATQLNPLVRVLTMELTGPYQMLLRIGHQYAAQEITSSQPIWVDVAALLTSAGLLPQTIYPQTLTANRNLTASDPGTRDCPPGGSSCAVHVGCMDVHTFTVNFAVMPGAL